MYLNRTIAGYFTPSIKGIIFLLLMVFYTSIRSQCLISNGGFERSYYPCSLGYSDTFGIKNLYSPFPLGALNTIDVFNSCVKDLSNPPPCNVSNCTPENYLGFQETRSGNGYIGIITCAIQHPPVTNQNTIREYFEIKLDTSLEQGKCYHFKMYCNFADSSYFISPSIGALFTDTLTIGMPNGMSVYLWLTPQIINDTANLDSLNWFSVEGNYIANGGERFITIGNFLTDSQTILYPYHRNVLTEGYMWSYIYIDDVSLIPCEADTVHGEKYTICYGDSINLKLDSLAPMPASPCDAGLNYCHWYDKRHTPLYSGFNCTIKPTRDTVLYTIRGNDTCSCGYYQDSFVIHVVQPIGKEKNHYDTLCAGETKQLIADTLQATYQWYNYSNILVANTKTYTVNPVNTTKYYLILQDTLQLCASRTDTFNMQVLDPPCAKIAIPTAFSPNGDGNNDVFAPIFYQNTTAEMQMRIYNRWGEIVYNGIGEWDGKYKGVLQPNDTYFYVVDINGDYFKGNVELMK